MTNRGLDLAICAIGSRYKLAKALNITPAAVAKWREVPVKRLAEVERLTGVDRSKLRPDIFRRK